MPEYIRCPGTLGSLLYLWPKKLHGNDLDAFMSKEKYQAISAIS